MYKFNIRVYGLIINFKHEILISDEYQLDTKMTKFPGGGLQFGEGTIDCLKREFKEECNGQEITNINHFYTTDFFQKALFLSNQQLISVYYTADLLNPLILKTSQIPFNFKELKNGNQSFRWSKIKTLKPDEFSFPIDKFVVSSLKNIYQ